MLLADGLMQLEVVDAGHARIVVGGDIPAGKGINLPSSRLDIPSLTDKDREDLAFGVAHGVDFVALSFVRRASDLDEVKATGVPVIAKIEKAEAVANLESIVRGRGRRHGGARRPRRRDPDRARARSSRRS